MKDSLNQQQQELVKNLYEQIGQLTVERDWLKKNLNCLDLEVRCRMISRDNQLTIRQQCELLSINRATYYYKPNNALDGNDLKVMTTIDEKYTMHPYFGTRRMAKYLQSQGL